MHYQSREILEPVMPNATVIAGVQLNRMLTFCCILIGWNGTMAKR